MKRMAVLSVVLLGACDADECRYVAGGVCVLKGDHVVMPGDVEAAVLAVDSQLRDEYPEFPGLEQLLEGANTKVQFLPGALAQNCTKIDEDRYHCSNPLDGYVRYGDGEMRIVVAVPPGKCLAYTALIHEVLHAVDVVYFGGGGTEDDHGRYPLFDAEYGSEAVENYSKIVAAAAMGCWARDATN